MKKHFLFLFLLGLLVLGAIGTAEDFERGSLLQTIVVDSSGPKQQMIFPAGTKLVLLASGTQGLQETIEGGIPTGADWFYCFACESNPAPLEERSRNRPSRVKIILHEEEIFKEKNGFPAYKDNHIYRKDIKTSSESSITIQGSLDYGGKLWLSIFDICPGDSIQRNGQCTPCPEGSKKDGFTCKCRRGYVFAGDGTGECIKAYRTEAQEQKEPPKFAVCSASEAEKTEHAIAFDESRTAPNLLSGAFTAIARFFGLVTPTGHQTKETTDCECTAYLEPLADDIENPPSQTESIEVIEMTSALEAYTSYIKDPKRGVMIFISGTATYGGQEEDIEIDAGFCFNKKCITANTPRSADLFRINEKPISNFLSNNVYNKEHKYTAIVQLPLSFNTKGTPITFSLSNQFPNIGITGSGLGGTFPEKNIAFTVETHYICKEGYAYMHSGKWSGKCIKMRGLLGK